MSEGRECGAIAKARRSFSQQWVCRPPGTGGQLVNVRMTRSLCAHTTLCSQHTRAAMGQGNIMSATQFGLGLLYIAVAVLCYAAGWWQAKTVERERWEKRLLSLIGCA
jgi:hypothetical protein